MLAALTWTHPVYGLVTERLCPTHELPARQAFAELGIDYTARSVVEGRCHRCDRLRPWQGHRDPADQASQPQPAPGGDNAPPPGAGWFQDGPSPLVGPSGDGRGGAPADSRASVCSVTGGARPSSRRVVVCRKRPHGYG